MSHQFVVEPYEAGLHQGNAYWMARLSELVYRTEDQSSRPAEQMILKSLQSEDEGFEKVWGFDRKSSQGMVVEHQNYLAMAFRGTDELSDWLDNIDIGKRETPMGVFHEGFWEATEDIWRESYRALRGAQQAQKARGEPKRPIFITGHSLGGAMATVAVAKLMEEDIPFTAAYTFGQPRVVDRATGQRFNSECRDRYWRFCNDMDIVTRIPARIGGFTHVGSVVFMDHDGKIEAKLSRWQQFMNKVEGIHERFEEEGWKGAFKSLKETVRDHDISKYREGIEKCREWPKG